MPNLQLSTADVQNVIAYLRNPQVVNLWQHQTHLLTTNQPLEHEYYVMQGEIYTAQAFSSTG